MSEYIFALYYRRKLKIKLLIEIISGKNIKLAQQDL